MRQVVFLSYAIMLLFYGGCIAVNEDCNYQERVDYGYSTIPFVLDKHEIRHKEAPIGNLIADAMMDLALDQGTDTADLAFVDAGLIRDYTSCGMRPELEAGTISDVDIESMLGPERTLVVLSVSKADFKAVLEHSVAKLGDPLAERQAQEFLQVSSQLQFEVNCDNQAYGINALGEDIAGYRIDDAYLKINGKSLDQWFDSEPIKVVVTDQLAEGKYNYYELSTSPILSGFSQSLQMAVLQYIEKLSPIVQEDVNTRTEPGVQGQQGRIRLFQNCY